MLTIGNSPKPYLWMVPHLKRHTKEIKQIIEFIGISFLFNTLAGLTAHSSGTGPNKTLVPCAMYLLSNATITDNTPANTFAFGYVEMLLITLISCNNALLKIEDF